MINEDAVIERSEIVTELINEIKEIKDIRIERCKKHSLAEVLFLVLCAQINNFETLREYELYGETKILFLKQYLPYKNDAPSRSTIGRILALISPKMLEEMYMKWMQQIIEKKNNQQEIDANPNVIAIGGKRLLGMQGDILHLVSAYDTGKGLVLGEEAVNNKSNEIAAIPILLDSLSIKGHIVSIDAAGCYEKIANKISEKKADYFLVLKGNQINLQKQAHFIFSNAKEIKKCEVITRINKEHGRIETRTC